MTTAPFSGGPLLPSDLLGIWRSVMDDSYTEPVIQAGDGDGLEAWTQAFAQLARVSQAVDASMESLFILPWSGQTNPPAQGPNRAIATVSIARTKLFNEPLILQAGLWVDEIAPGWSPAGTVYVVTGRRYALAETLVFAPGDAGPHDVQVIAERPGYGYNNPLPGTLSAIEQPGTLYYNVDAAIVNTCASLPVAPTSRALASMTVIDVPHVVIQGHVGQYVLITAGLNAGEIVRMISFRGANPGVDGGSVGLELVCSVQGIFSIGTFAGGETVAVVSGDVGTAIAAGSDGQTLPQATIYVASTAGFPASGVLDIEGNFVQYQGISGNTFTGCTGGTRTLHTGDDTNSVSGYAGFVDAQEVGGTLEATFVVLAGTVTPDAIFVGLQSGAILEAGIVYRDASALQGTTPANPPALVPSSESWRVLDWVRDWGIEVTNAEQPSGGTADMLGLLGRERGLPQIAGESTEQYRQRIATIADTVTPNAVMRRLNKVLTQGPLQLSWCLREIGTPRFPGFFYDADFYDYDAQLFDGISDPDFFQDNEPVTQTVGGVVATGSILITHGIPVTPYVPGDAGATGIPNGQIIQGVSGIRLGYPFVGDVPVVGTLSGQTLTPPFVEGGLLAANAWRIYVDFLRMRAYFVVCVQRSSAGDFGFGWGSGSSGVGALADWWDAGPAWNDFYDGSPRAAAGANLTAFHAVNAIRAAGVFFEVLPVSGPCS